MQSQKNTQMIPFGEFDISEVFNQAIKGKVKSKGIVTAIFKLFGNEILYSFNSFAIILIIVIIHSIFKAFSENLGNSGSGKVAYYIQYLMIVSVIIQNFAIIIEDTKITINNLVGMMNTLVPILITLMLTTGNLVSANVVQPILFFVIGVIGNFVSSFIIPLVLIGLSLSIVSNLSDNIKIDKLSKYIKSSVVWMLGIALTVFVCLLSVEGTLSSSVDGITAKTAKAAVSSFIPIVGKVLGDSVDTVIGCASILKNAVGVIGIVIIIGIVLKPIIKLTIITIMYHLLAGLCEIFADKNIVKLFEQIGNTFKVLLAVLCTIAVLFIVGVTLTIKMTNSSLMYR